ncbi:MAG: hypothetical protein WA826_10570, partial [Silvibacterium sp.]
NQTMDGGPTLTGSSNGMLQELAQINQTLDGVTASTSAPQSTSATGNVTPASAQAKTPVTAAVGNLSSTSNAKSQAAAETVADALASPNHSAGTGQTPSSQSQAFEQFAARLKANAERK